MQYINYGKQEILGDDERAERLYEWSLKKSIGTNYTKELKCGLSLKFVADDTEPKVYISWNPAKFNALVDLLGKPDTIALNHFGIEVILDAGKVRVAIIDDSDEGLVLLSSSVEDQKSGLLGMIRIGEEGPYLHLEDEINTVIGDVQVTAKQATDSTVNTLATKFVQPKENNVAALLIKTMNERYIQNKNI